MENRLTTVRRSDSTVVATFDYDALGRRIEKVDAIAGTTTRYYYDDQRVAVQTRVAGGVETDFRYYVFGNTIDEVLVMGFRLSSVWVYLYYGHDHLYSPVGIFAPSGALMERYEYDAYGKVRITGIGPDAAWFTADDVPRTTSLYANPYTFTGRELDTLDNNSLHLMYYRARTTDPEPGRFMQRDPLLYIDGMNLYEYGLSNPLLNLDYSGTSTISCSDCQVLYQEKTRKWPPNKPQKWFWFGQTNKPVWELSAHVRKTCGDNEKWKVEIDACACSISGWYYINTPDYVKDVLGNTPEQHEKTHASQIQSAWLNVQGMTATISSICTCNKRKAECFRTALGQFKFAMLTYVYFQANSFDCQAYAPGPQRDVVCANAETNKQEYEQKMAAFERTFAGCGAMSE